MGLSGFSGTDSGLCHGRECPELFLFKKKRKAKNNCPSPSNALQATAAAQLKKLKIFYLSWDPSRSTTDT